MRLWWPVDACAPVSSGRYFLYVRYVFREAVILWWILVFDMSDMVSHFLQVLKGVHCKTRWSAGAGLVFLKCVQQRDVLF